MPLDDSSGNPFDQFGEAAATAPPTANPFDQFDKGTQWTKENPLVPKTQDEIEAATPGSWIKGPITSANPTGLMQKPAPVAPTVPMDQATQQPLDFSGMQPLVRDTGIIGAIPAGLVQAGRGVAATAQTLAGKTPAASEEPELLAAQPMHWADFLSPGTLAKKTLYQFAASAPTMAGAIFGGAAGTMAGGGPEEPLGWATGIAGTATGAALGTTIQSLGQNFGQALQETKGDGEAAWNLALKRTGVEAAGSAAGFSAFSVAPFSNTVKNLMFQAFGVQPALAAGQRALENVTEGRAAGEGVAEAIPGAVIGTAAPLAAHEAVRQVAGRNAVPATAAPSATAPTPAAAAPPTTAPPVGSTFGMRMPDENGNVGVVPVTVTQHTAQGDIGFRTADGTDHVLPAADIARLRTELPQETPPNAPAVAPEAIPPAIETPPAEGAARPTGAEGAGTPAGEGVAPPTVEHEDAEIRAATVAQAPTGEAEIAQRLAADQAELAAPIPAAEPSPEAPPLHDYMADYEANRARTETAAAPTEAEIPPRGDYRDAALDLIRQKGPDARISTGWLMSQLKIPRNDADMVLTGLEQEGVVGPQQGNRRQVLAPPQTADAISALTNLGYGRREAVEAINASGTPEGADTGAIVAAALARLGRGMAPRIEPPAPAAEARPPMPFQTIRGTTEPAFIPSTGAAVPIEYGIADARNLITSHHDDLSPNTEYPQALQPRNRERAETEAQLAGILNGDSRDPEARFRPELLGENPDAANGAPIVGPEGYVESGNARSMAMRRAYERGLPQAEEYRRYLEAQGYPVAGIEQPVLVRLNRAGMDMPQREQLARDLNVPPQAAMSATEQAMADAKQIPAGLLAGYAGGDIFSAQNKGARRAILESFVRTGELPAMTDPEGDLSLAGRRRVAAALLAKAYGDPGLVTALTEDADSNIKAIGGALMDAAPSWIRLRDAIADGRIPEAYDLTSPLLAATRLIAHARDTGRNVVEFTRQGALFGEGVPVATQDMLKWFLGEPDYTRRYGRQKIADTLAEYADSVTRPLRLGETRAAPEELRENAREVAHGAAGDLFASVLGQSGGATPVRVGPGENRPEAQRPESHPIGMEPPEGGAGGAEGRPQGGLTLEHPAYHGSPYTFDQFTLDHIGKGEGAQAYGHGLYFAGNKSIAEYYRQSFLNRGADAFEDFIVSNRGKRLNDDDLRQALRANPLLTDIADNDAGIRAAQILISGAYRGIGMHSASEVRAYSTIGEILEKQRGRLYQVELAPKEDEYLDWDKPLRLQSDKVKEAIKPLYGEVTTRPLGPPPAGYVDQHLTDLNVNGQNLGAYPAAELEGKDLTKFAIDHDSSRGEQIYRQLIRDLSAKERAGLNWTQAIRRGPADASQALLKAGIRGIRYADQGSRNITAPATYSGDMSAIQRLGLEVLNNAGQPSRWERDPVTLRRILIDNYTTSAEAKAKGNVHILPTVDEHLAALKSLDPEKIIPPHQTHNYVIFDPGDITIKHLEEEKARGAQAGQPVGAGAYRNTRDDYLAYRANTAYPETPEGTHASARGYVRQRGSETGNEYLAVHDPQGNEIAHVGTSDLPDRVSFASEGLDARLADPNAGLTIHHNHPGDAALSGTDIAALAHPGVDRIVAHGHGQDVFIARLTPEAKAAVANLPPRLHGDVGLSLAYQKANSIVRSALQMQTLAGKISPREFDALQADLANRALDAAGIIDYVGTRAPAELTEPVRRGIIGRAAGEAADAAGINLKLPPLTDGEIRARLDRSTLVSRPDEAMAGLHGVVQPGGPEAARGAGAPEGGPRGIAAAAEGEEALVGRGINDTGIHQSANGVQFDEGVGRLPQPNENALAGRAGHDLAGGEGVAGAEAVGAPGSETPSGGRGLAEGQSDAEIADRIRAPGGGGGGEPPEPPGGPPAGNPPADPERRKADLARIMHTDDRGWLDHLREAVARIREGGFLAFRQYWQDQLAALETQEKSIHGGALAPGRISATMSARFARNWHSTLDVALNHSQVRYNADSGVIEPIEGSKPLRAIWKQLSDDQRANGRPTADDFALWSIAKRADRLMAEGREHNVPPGMIERYRDLDKAYQNPDGTNLFQQVHDELQAWHKNLLDLGEASGIVNKDSRQLWEHDDYVPFYRALDPEGVAAPGSGGKGIVNVRSPIRYLKGGEAKINNIYENTVLNASAMIRRSMANIAAQKARTDLLFNTDALTPMSREARVPYGDPVVQQSLRDAGLDPQRLTDAAKDGARDLFGALKRRDPDVISVMDNGRANYYRVRDPYLLQSLTAAGPSTLTGVGALLAAPARLLRAAVVFDPAFALAHNLRMAEHAYILTGTSPIASMGAALRQARGLDPVALRLMASGAMSGRYDVELPKHIRTEISSPEYQRSLIDTPLKAARFVKEFGEGVMRASDIGPRIAVYRRALSQGASEAEAMNQARDLLDFSTHGAGSAALFLAQTIPFLNARWQGMARSARGFMGPDRNAIFMRGALVTAATLALWAQNKDDPEYQRKEDWDRQYAWQIKVAPGMWFRLPRPFELGAMFGSLPEMIADYHNNGSTRTLGNAAGAMFSNVFKFNPIPVAIRPVVEAWWNHDTFTGAPIINEREQALEPDLQYGPSDSASVIAATHAFNSVSPYQVAPANVQHLVRGYLAGWGTYITTATDYLGEQAGVLPSMASPAETPVVGRFLHTEPEPSNRLMSDYYDLKKQVAGVGDSIKAANRMQDTTLAASLQAKHPEFNPGIEKAMNKAGTNLSRIRDVYQRAELNPNLSAEQKTVARDQYYRQRDQLLDTLKPLLRQAEGLPAQP